MLKILRADPGIGFGLRIGIVVASTRVRDDAVTGGGKGRLLIAAPDQGATRGRMEKDDSRSGAPGIGVPEPRLGKLR